MKSLWNRLAAWLDGKHPHAGRRRTLAVTAAGLLVWAIFGGKQGLFALVLSQHEKYALERQIADLNGQNADLATQIGALERDPGACEKTAREKLQLMRPGETIYRFR